MPKRGKYHIRYARRVNKKIATTRTVLESGLLCEFYYIPKDSNQKKRYIVLILRSHFIGPNHYMLHALSLEHIPEKYFDDFVKKVGITMSSTMRKIKKINIERVLLHEKKSKQFYITELRKWLKFKFEGSYRTFIFKNIKKSYVLDFDFKDIPVTLAKDRDTVESTSNPDTLKD